MGDKVNCKECANLNTKGGLRTYGRCRKQDNKLIKTGPMIECEDFIKRERDAQEFYDGGYDIPDFCDSIEPDGE